MNPEPSPADPRPPGQAQPRRHGLAAWTLTGVLYVGVALGLRVACYRWEWNEILFIPLAGELLLLSTPWSRRPVWKGILARAAALALAGWLFHWTYLVPVVYEGGEPWAEEIPWAWVIVAAQLLVALLLAAAGLWIRRARTG